MLHNTMNSVYTELSLSRDYNTQVTSRHHATYRTHNSNDRRQATRDPEDLHTEVMLMLDSDKVMYVTLVIQYVSKKMGLNKRNNFAKP